MLCSTLQFDRKLIIFQCFSWKSRYSKEHCQKILVPKMPICSKNFHIFTRWITILTGKPPLFPGFCAPFWELAAPSEAPRRHQSPVVPRVPAPPWTWNEHLPEGPCTQHLGNVEVVFFFCRGGGNGILNRCFMDLLKVEFFCRFERVWNMGGFNGCSLVLNGSTGC